jgi:hypothetical protein
MHLRIWSDIKILEYLHCQSKLYFFNKDFYDEVSLKFLILIRHFEILQPIKAKYCMLLCLVADKGPSLQCSQNPGSSLRREKDGYLSSLVAKETGLGGPECPWVIQVPAGQRINVTLFDFALSTSYSRSPDICNIYATIREGSRLETNVCGGEKRVKNTFLSETNRIEVVMSPLVTGKHESDASIPHFLLHYKG